MKSRFVTALTTQYLSDTQDILIRSFVYASAHLKREVVVPSGFVTDYASVPRLPLAYLATGGTAREAAVIHDFLYRQSGVARADADAVFLEAMEVSGQPRWRRTLMWMAVRLFGGACYQEKPA